MLFSLFYAYQWVNAFEEPPFVATQVQLHLLPPDEASTVSTTDSFHSKYISGGLVFVNMTGYSPVPETGTLAISLPIGYHRISLSHPDYVFEDIMVHIKSASPIKTYLQPFDVHGSARGPLLSTDKKVIWKAQKRRVYQEQRQGFQLFGIFRSPMMLMALFSLLMVYAMPKLASHIEQEAQANGAVDPQLNAQKNELIKLFEGLQ